MKDQYNQDQVSFSEWAILLVVTAVIAYFLLLHPAQQENAVLMDYQAVTADQLSQPTRTDTRIGESVR